MIQDRSLLRLGDNSGAKLVQCIKVYKTKKIVLGSLILVTIKQVRLKSKLKKGELYKAIVIRLNRLILRKNGHYIKCSENAVVLLGVKGDLYGTRLTGPVTNELRKRKLTKILSLTKFII